MVGTTVKVSATTPRTASKRPIMATLHRRIRAPSSSLGFFRSKGIHLSRTEGNDGNCTGVLLTAG
jgi:hypothetical protein